jgi:hypothetical protein
MTKTIQLLLNLATTISFVDGWKGIEIEVVSNSYRELNVRHERDDRFRADGIDFPQSQ